MTARQIGSVIRWNFRGFCSNPRIILTFLFAFILCFFLSEGAMEVAEHFDAPMQALEPFIWTFGDAGSILLSSLLLILLFLDLPKLSPFTPYFLLYMLYVLAVTSVLCMKKTYAGNLWSKTAALLAYSGMGKQMSIPSSVKVMESTSPAACCLGVVLLLTLYALTLSFLMLYAQLKVGKRGAAALGLAYSLLGFLLDPKTLAQILRREEHEMFFIRRVTGWISPLNHATYGMHDFGYDVLPSIRQSCLFFAAILLLLALASFHALKAYNFHSFTGEVG